MFTSVIFMSFFLGVLFGSLVTIGAAFIAASDENNSDDYDNN